MTSCAILITLETQSKILSNKLFKFKSCVSECVFWSFASTLRRQACKWVMGSIRRGPARWGCGVCYRDRESPELSWYPRTQQSYLKATPLQQDKLGQARHTLWTWAAVFDHIFATFQIIILTYCTDSLSVKSCCGYPCVVQKTPVRAQDVYSKLSQTWE